MHKKPTSKNSIIRFIEFCGTHPFVTGLFAIVSVASFAFAIYANTQSSQGSERIERSVEGVRSIVGAGCSSPPCWSAAEAIGNILGSTKDYVDGKIGVASSKGSDGWQYNVDGCSIRVHYSDDIAIYLSHQLSPSCPLSWSRKFGINSPMPSYDQVTVDDLFRTIFADQYPPQLHIATGCVTCGNYHEPYIEFRIPGPHVADFYDRYFTIDFSAKDGSDYFDNNRSFAESIKKETGKDPYGRMNEYCGVDIRQSAVETTRNLSISGVGYGRRGWGGRTGYALDICNEGYTAR